jgi:hypothetical protein
VALENEMDRNKKEPEKKRIESALYAFMHFNAIKIYELDVKLTIRLPLHVRFRFIFITI